MPKNSKFDPINEKKVVLFQDRNHSQNGAITQVLQRQSISI